MLSLSRKTVKNGWIETRLGLAIFVALVGIGTSILLVHFVRTPAIFAGPTNPKRTANPAESLVAIPKGILPLTPPELFNPDNLYEKIDGQAGLYLSAGFLRLKSQSFGIADNNDLWVDLFVYDMGNVLNAKPSLMGLSGEREKNVYSVNFVFPIIERYPLYFLKLQIKGGRSRCANRKLYPQIE